MRPIDWQTALTELFMAQRAQAFSCKTSITATRQHQMRTRMRTTANPCSLTRYDLADPDRKTFSNLALQDSASRVETQDISQQTAPPQMGNLGRKPNREKGDVSRGRQLYWRDE